MKKIFTYASVLMGFVISQSCSKQSAREMVMSPAISTQIINAEVKNNATYQLPLDKFQNVTIVQQASHFQLSSVGLDNKTGLLLYKYQPAQDYTGTDEVLLSTSKNVVSAVSGENCNNREGSYMTTAAVVTSNINIKIKVSDN